MGSRRFNLFVILFVVGLLLGSGLIISSKPTRLGLDLRGGTQLIYEAQPTPQNPTPAPEDVDRAIEIVRDRVDSLGVAEPEISRLGGQSLQVNLPDVQDTARAIDQVGETAQLFFYDFEPNVVPIQDGVDEVTPANRDQQTTPSLYEAVELASKQPGDPDCSECSRTGAQFYAFDERNEELLVGPEDDEQELIELPEVQEVPEAQRTIFEVKQGTIVVKDQDLSSQDNPDAPSVDRYVVLRDKPSLSGEDIQNPEQNFDPQGNQPNVTFDFTNEGRMAFRDVTAEIAQRGAEAFPPVGDYSFAIVLDDEIVSRPVIDFQENPLGIDGRTGAQISGGFDIQEAQDLAEFLRLGALPVELELISQSTISATLGQQALDESVIAGLVGLALVMLFLIAYYRFLGLVAALGLLAYAAFFFALMKLIPITLTLPGIAGLILTVGVAADSNIVIFERIKEEARAGHSMLSAITTGYRRGIATIIDANAITLLTAFILFGLATGGVKGFAFTLGVGVLVSLFTAVVFTRAILATLGRSKLLTDPRYAGAGEQKVRWHFDFAGASKWFFSASGAILAVGALSFATNQINFGIDFESGTLIKAALVEPAQIEEVRTSLADAGVEAADAAKIQAVNEPEFGDNVVQIQGQIDPELIGQVQNQLEDDFGLQVGVDDVGEQGGFQNQSVGPTFGAQVARSAGYAIVFSLILISAYMAFRFEAKYAVPVMIAVIHDVLITAGIYSLTDREVSSATVAAFLTILGYSLYDTVIVFDRIRENVPRLPRATFAQIANRSLSEVLTRSLITGLSTVFLIGVILIFGGETLGDFAFAMMVGVLSGTYSSIFIGTPVLIAWKERESGYRARAAQIKEVMGYVPAFPEDNVVAKVGGSAPGADGGGNGHGDASSDVIEHSPVREAEPDGGNGAAVGPEADDQAAVPAAPEPDPEQEAKRARRAERKRANKGKRRQHGRPR
ncbi:MAG: protein translocase subunit SecD [Solirubrobacterales bacterium]